MVIAAAVLLFIASFLGMFDDDGDDAPTAWDDGSVLLSVYLIGIVGALLIAVGRAQQPARKVAGLELGQIGVAFTIASALSALFKMFDLPAYLDAAEGFPTDQIDAGTGTILGLIAALVLAAAAIATNLVPALKAPLMGAPRPAAPQYGGQPQGGYGYPGAQQGQPQQPYGQQQPQHSQGGFPQPGPAATQPGPQQGGAPQPAGDFSPFWFAVPVQRPLYAEDGSPTPIAELAPGTWYLAVEQRGPGLVAQTQDGRRGVLQDTTGIQRG
ncbi:hypothetical protein SAMN05421806_10456 [Streptomyces indicus]|uniref:Uncharacterized protein n=1 Tax=Streptomyces indicus TaxID=417292 RepID=A0A1G8YGC2_9ACTN|nr:hypothetical protein SAMN05421806_10456 [Streptomyces indicus]